MTPFDDEAVIPLAAGFAPATRDQWLSLVSKVLRGRSVEQSTYDGIAVEPLYTRVEGGGIEAQPAASFARAHPGWEISQLHAEPDPGLASLAIRDDVDNGADGLTLRFQSSGQSGLPARLDALAEALHCAPLDCVRVSLSAGESTREAASSMLALWRARDTPIVHRRAAINADPLGDVARTGALAEPIERAVTLAAQLAAEEVWADHPVSVLLADGRPYHEAGGSEGQELAGMVAGLVAYLRACEEQDLPPGRALSRIGLALAADADFFMTIAKLRAARLLAVRVAEACGTGGAAHPIRLFCSTSERMMARRDPWVNMLRTTAACMGAVLGGADSITVLPFTWALGRPDASARRIARNTQIVLRDEAALGRVADVGHGSWYVEQLTRDLARAAWTLFQSIEAEGGMAAALRSGFMQDKVAEVAAARQRALATGVEQLTSVTAFPRLGDDGVTVEPHAPVGAVSKGYGQLRPLAPMRLSAPFEALRDSADAYRALTGRAPQIFLACLGTPIDFGQRATSVRNLLAAGGVEVIDYLSGNGGHTATAAFTASGAKVACICSSDDVYRSSGAETVRALKAAGADFLIVAGRPAKLEAALRDAGADVFVSPGIDALDLLQRLHEAMDVRSS